MKLASQLIILAVFMVTIGVICYREGYGQGYARGLADAPPAIVPPAIVQSTTGRGSSNVVGGGNITITCRSENLEENPK